MKTAFINKLLESEYSNIIRNTIVNSIPKINDSDVDDLVQEVYLDVLKKKKSIENHPDIQGWLCIATKYVIKRYWRSKSVDLVPLEFVDEIEDPTSFENIIEDNEYVKKLMVFINKSLSWADYEIFDFKCIKRLSNDQIAEILDIKRTAVDAKVTRLRKKLKNIIKSFDDKY